MYKGYLFGAILIFNSKSERFSDVSLYSNCCLSSIKSPVTMPVKTDKENCYPWFIKYSTSGI